MMDYYSSPLFALLYIMFSRQNENTRKLPKIGDFTRDICILFLYTSSNLAIARTIRWNIQPKKRKIKNPVLILQKY